MSRSNTSRPFANAYYRAAVDDLIRARTALRWSQYELARRWKRHQSVVAKIETCERRLELIEFVDLCVILDIDPHAIIAAIHAQMKENLANIDDHPTQDTAHLPTADPPVASGTEPAAQD